MDQERITDHGQEKTLRWGAWLLIALSFSLLAFYQIVRYEKWIILSTVLPAIPISLLLLEKTWDEISGHIRAHPFQSVAYFFAALIIIFAMRMEKGCLYLDVVFHPLPFLAVRFFRFRWMIFAAPALFYLLVWIGLRGTKLFSCFWDSLNETDRKLYTNLTLLASVTVLIAYALNSEWFLQYDVVYSIDSGWCYSKILPRLSYYDIRHPIMSVVTFPVWAVIHTLLQWFVPAQLLDIFCAACIQGINIQALLLTGFMIYKLSESRWTLMIYLASSPVLIFTVLFEKYQMAVFFLVLYVYKLCKGEERTEASLVFATGMMPTSVLLYVDELLQKQPIAVKFKRIGKTILCGIAVLICAGRVHLLNPKILLDEMYAMAARFGIKGYPLKSCFFSLTNMVHGAFLGLSSAHGKKYSWTNILDQPSIIGIALLAIVLLGFFTNHKERFTRICGLWTVVSGILFCWVQWSVHDSPLFSLYFAWALIPLFQRGFQFILEKFHWNERIAYSCILIPAFAVNFIVLIDIGKFLT